MTANPNLSSPLTTKAAITDAVVNGLTRAVVSPAARVFSSRHSTNAKTGAVAGAVNRWVLWTVFMAPILFFWLQFGFTAAYEAFASSRKRGGFHGTN